MARLSRAMIYSKEGKVVSNDPVSANMPTGSVQAAAMTMHTKTKLAQFRGNVAVRLLPQQGQTLGTGRDARQPVDIRAEELDIDDAPRPPISASKVVAMQGETMLQTPYLVVKYEGKAAAALAVGPAAAGRQGQPPRPRRAAARHLPVGPQRGGDHRRHRSAHRQRARRFRRRRPIRRCSSATWWRRRRRTC